ncbi:MAG: tRNA 4-thiouridine(8) synthase ThiI [Desulfobacter sp.]|nr:MAG: tRNA 4-thiouridine(8) synthase ThiI [Desulfobacter sp.]
MNENKTTTGIKALGLCSGGLDSILSALVLREQGIEVTWVSFETPFFNAKSAKKASKQTGVPLIVKDITPEYLEMMRAPHAGFGKNMNPCMDCHALMFAQAGKIMEEQGFDFLFSGEVMGQRPKSQTKNALRYVEKNSGYDGYIVRPLSGKILPETRAEQDGLVDREQLLDITGRGRKRQMELADKFGITEFPSPAGGCVLTDKGFSIRLRDLLYVQKTEDPVQLRLLNHGRHFRLSDSAKLIVGRNKGDNKRIMALYDPDCHIRLRHAGLPGPDAIFYGSAAEEDILLAARITAGYTKAQPGDVSLVRVFEGDQTREVKVTTPESGAFHDLLVPPPT